MNKRFKVVVTLLAATTSLVVISGCGLNSEDRGSTTSIDPINQEKWYIHRIRTAEGGIIKADFVESWKSDQMYGTHLAPETYTLEFSNRDDNKEVIFTHINGATVNGVYRKEKGGLFIDFENGKSFIGNSYVYDEYSQSYTLTITDKSNDVCYEFYSTASFYEEDYQVEKSKLNHLIDNNLTNINYKLYSINGLLADGTHYYHEELFDKNTYSIRFETSDKEKRFYLINNISETESKTAAFNLTYDASMNTEGLYLVPKLTFISELSNMAYYEKLKVDFKTKTIGGNNFIDNIYVEFGSTTFVFK